MYVVVRWWWNTPHHTEFEYMTQPPHVWGWTRAFDKAERFDEKIALDIVAHFVITNGWTERPIGAGEVGIGAWALKLED